jgi:Tol biopolymer transport system component
VTPDPEAPDDDIDPIDPDDPSLAAIADAILDGGEIDWSQARSKASTDPALARQLRALADVASLHRALSSGDAATPREAGPDTTRPTWGHLQLLEKVGQGAFGEVFRAWDPHLSREVALKLLGPAMGQGADDRSWVLQEARFLAAIRHPNVVTVYGADRIDGRVGFWTEFIHGRTLAELVHDADRMSADEATAIGVDVCRAIAAVHREGLLHRDIKANNVMRERGGRIVLLDFGATRNFVEHTGAEDQIGDPNGPTGTPLYVAPELWGQSVATPQSDIYSLGVLLYFLVTGSYPVKGATVGEVADAHRAGKRLGLGQARQDLPANFVATVERAIATDPAARFGTIEEFEQALATVGQPPKRATFASRMRLAGVAAVLIAGAVLYPTWPRGNADDALRRHLSERALVLLTAPSMRGVQPSATQAPGPVATPPVAPQQPPAPEPPKQTPLQVGATVVMRFPAIGRIWSRPSRDGRHFAFIDDLGRVGVWSVETHLASIQITPSPGDRATSALISRPGDRIAFVLRHSDGSHDVHVTGRDGSRPIVVLELRTGYVPQLADWSHDGKELVCWLVQANQQADLVVLPIQGGDRQVLASKAVDSYASASMSPDGRFVAFGRVAENRSDAVLVGRDGAPLREFEAAGSPEWTADGRHLLVFRQSSTKSGARDAWLLPVKDGIIVGVPVKVTENIGGTTARTESFPTDDGRLLAVVPRSLVQIQAARFDVASGRTIAAPMRLIYSRIGDWASPSWSPDGKTIALFETQPPALPGTPQGGSLQTLYIASGSVFPVRTSLFWQGTLRPAWLPDGKHVIVWGEDADSRDRRGHYLVNVRTSEAKALDVDGDPYALAASALPDGTGFVYQDPRGFVSRTFTGQETVLIASSFWKGLGARLAIAPDGTRWAFGAVTPDGRSVIMVNEEGGKAREVFVAASDEAVDVECWTPSGSAVIFSRQNRQSSSRTIWIVNRDGSNEHEVGLTLPVQPNPITINPDGTRIAYPERVIEHELWIRRIQSARR